MWEEPNLEMGLMGAGEMVEREPGPALDGTQSRSKAVAICTSIRKSDVVLCSGPKPRLRLAGGSQVCDPSSLWKAGDHRHQGEPAGGQGGRNRLSMPQGGLCATELAEQESGPTVALSPSRSFLMAPGYWDWQVGWLRGCP